MNDTAPMAVLLMNLKATQSWIDQVVIYHNGISAKDQSLMHQIIPVEFVRYRFPGRTKNFNEIIRYVYTETIFCKYECLKLLERFDHVVWTDYDVLFMHDVPELVNFDSTPSGMKIMIAESEHGCSRFQDQIRGEGRKKMAEICPLDKLSVFTNLMSFSRKLEKAPELYAKCIELTERFGEWLVLPEQAIFDMALEHLQIQPEALSWDYAVRPIAGQAIPQNAHILHSIAQPKFWNGLHNETWDAHYSQWLDMGGSPWHPAAKFSWRNLKKKWFFFLKHIFRK